MRLSHILGLSWQAIFSHKRRSFFTMLGLMIGVAAVILVMAIGAGAEHLITAQIRARGTDMIAVLAGASDEKGPPAQAFGIIVTTLTADDGEALIDPNKVAHAASVAAYISGNDVLRWKNVEENVTYTGATPSYEQIEGVTIADGRFFTEEEDKARANVVVLGAAIANDIFGNQPPVGESVRLKRELFRVIGVLAPQGATIFENPDTATLIPLKTAQDKLLGVKHVSFLRLIVDDEKNISQTVAEVKQTLIERHGDEDFSVRNVADVLQILTTVTGAIRFFLAAIAAISLIVGGIGIMNVMLMSVKEKTKEVGLRKALGATNRDILLQFLFETVYIALIGGSVGIIAGTIIAFVISVIVKHMGYDYAFIISPATVILGLFISALIGIIFGTVPARRAARLDPIEALRYE